MFKEFKEFANKGNIINLAVGVIIGGAFQKIVTSLVNDIVMPIISILTGKVNYSDLNLKIGNVSIKCGSFITSVIDFLIIAFSVFLFVKYINKINQQLEKINYNKLEELNKRFKIFPKSKKENVSIIEPKTKECPYCCSIIDIKASRCPNCTSVLDEIDN